MGKDTSVGDTDKEYILRFAHLDYYMNTALDYYGIDIGPAPEDDLELIQLDG